MNASELLRFLSGPSKALAVQIVIYRLLGIRQELAVICMEELHRRKVYLEDDFDYEFYIKTELENSPATKMDSKEKKAFLNLLNMDFR